uniref:Uncharacterized protein n=1 Tax=Arion vulgaris TaxID=1028688 RepID=A0A0B7B699_9EUPU
MIDEDLSEATNKSELETESHATHLDDDKPVTAKEYEGATLQIVSGENVADVRSDVENPTPASPQPSSSASTTSDHDVAFSRNRPGSVIGRASVRSTSSRTSMRPGHVQTEVSARSYLLQGKSF